VATPGIGRRLSACLLAAGSALVCCILCRAQDIVRFNHDVPGDSKSIVLHADQIATWVEGPERVLLLKGKVMIEHGGVHIQAEQAAAWLDQEEYRKTGIQRLTIYAEGNVVLENGTESQTTARALIRLSTRGEIKLRSHNSKVIQQPYPGDPLYQRGQQQRSAPGKTSKAADTPPRRAPIIRAQNADESVTAQSPSVPSVPEQNQVPATGGVAPAVQLPAPDFRQPAVPAAPALAAPGPAAGASPAAPGLPPFRPAQIPVPSNTVPPGSGGQPNAPNREFTVVPRTSAGFNQKSFDLGGETAIVVTGGVILIVRAADGSGLLDMEADRLVFWTRGNAQELLGSMRSSHGSGKELEFYLSGNVQIRSRRAKEERLLQADEVYYDVGRNVAVALRADMSFVQPGVADPIHMKAQELLQLNPDVFKGMKAEVFSSRLPSDPGIKVYLETATITHETVPRRNIFGAQFFSRTTGQPETEEQRILDGRNVFLKFEDYPIFYLPFVQGDINDPLGPLESISFNYNRIFGFQFDSSFNVYNLLGMDPVPNTRWRFDLDYLSSRGPAAGTNFDYQFLGNRFTDLFGFPGFVVGEVKAYGIDDTGTDRLGGPRGPDDNHPEGRGRFYWRQNAQELPLGFTVQTQVSVLSDKNFLEQYFKNDFDTGFNQETFLYVKQQQNNWAWTALAEPNIRNWVNETEWLPRADGHLIGQSFFDIFTYNARASAAYARLRTTDVPPPPEGFTTRPDNTGRFDLSQELSLPFTLGPFRLVPYGLLDLTYYTEDLTGNDRGRAYGGGGVRGSIPFTRLYPDICSELLNLNAINHKVVLSANYFVAQSDTSFRRLPQLDRLNDDATDQALRDIKPLEPAINPAHGTLLALSPVYDAQLYAIRRLVDDRIDTLDTIEVLQGDVLQRWQTKRGYPGQQHIVDWMTLDLSGSFFPHSQRDNFGDNFAFLQYNWNWNIGDRTAIYSDGWVDPESNGPRVFAVGATINRPDRTSFTIGYRDIFPLNSNAISGAVTYIFSPKYAITAVATYDIGTDVESTSVVVTRTGSDLQASLGFTYNSTLGSFGVVFEIVPNIVPPSHRVPGLVGASSGLIR